MADEWLYGRNAVLEMLRANRRTVKQLIVADGGQQKGTLAAIVACATERQLPIISESRHYLDQVVQHANHQGVMARCSSYPYAESDAWQETAYTRKEQPLLLLLDHIQDPQNIGTLLRTAEVVGVHGVMLPQRRASGITPAVVNASSGATEHLTILSIGNVAHTIRALQQEGVWVVGVEHDERAKPFDTIAYDMPLALVIGAEGTGLARLTRERCDILASLPMRGTISSLNAAVAGSIVLYHVSRQRAIV